MNAGILLFASWLLTLGSVAAVRAATPETGTTPPLLATGDPDLEPGFPVQQLDFPGGYQGGPGIHTLIGDIDGDAPLEILVSGLSGGYLYAWNHDGSAVPGWPIRLDSGAAYPALGPLDAASPASEVFVGHFHHHGPMAGVSGDGTVLPGWPRPEANFVSDPAAVVDLDADGAAEVMLCEENSRLHGYRADGTVLPGWPVSWVFSGGGGQECTTPSVADLDHDGALDIVTVTGWNSAGVWLIGVRRDGTALPGFPVRVKPAFAQSYTAIGDVDGDGEREIVLAVPGGIGLTVTLSVYSPRGERERQIDTPGHAGYGSAPTLADLDGDGIPEIILQTDVHLFVFDGRTGSPEPGWPQQWANRDEHWLGNSAPVVGDVNGDQKPDILVVSEVAAGYGDSQARLYNADGTLDPRFPKPLPLGGGAVPAIADIDEDGRNEVVVSGNAPGPFPPLYDAVWAYDLGNGPHGAVHWGQFKAEAGHRGVYPLGLTPMGVVVHDAGGNGVLEPGERATIVPRWRNLGTFTRTLAGVVTGFSSPGDQYPLLYQVLDGSANHGAVLEDATTDCEGMSDCYRVRLGRPRGRPKRHWDATLREDLVGGPGRSWTVHVGGSFADVAPTSPFYPSIETLFHHSLTGGCSTAQFCPSAPTTRAEMAALALLAKEGSGYTPPACTTPTLFDDVPVDGLFCSWIEELARRGVVGGCGSGSYCPDVAVTREQMAVFVLKTIAPGLSPPACGQPVFADVSASSTFCPWIEELARRGAVAGCGGGHYCPGAPVTREQMAAIVGAGFGLKLYGP